MAFLSRDEEIDLIVESLEKELNDLVGKLRKIKKRVCQPASHTDMVSRRIDTIDNTIKLYREEQKEIQWKDKVDGVISKI
jgi:septal ring factor EnvC (AmiA/AmiB activator)